MGPVLIWWPKWKKALFRTRLWYPDITNYKPACSKQNRIISVDLINATYFERFTAKNSRAITYVWVDKHSQLFSPAAAKSCEPLTWHPYKPLYSFHVHSPLLCWRVGEVTLRMQGVSWPSLSCEESLERSLERRRSRERSQPPLAPCRLIFLCSASTRDARAWLLLFKTKAYLAFLSFLRTRGYLDFAAVKLWHTVHTYFADKLRTLPDVVDSTS